MSNCFSSWQHNRSWKTAEETSSSSEEDEIDGSDSDDDASNDTDSNSDSETPKFFIAGKFDPLLKRVTSWDEDISRELHLHEHNLQ